MEHFSDYRPRRYEIEPKPINWNEVRIAIAAFSIAFLVILAALAFAVVVNHLV